MKFLLFLASCLFLINAGSFAQDARRYTCYRTVNKIVADGNLSEPDWNSTEWSAEFVDITGKSSLKPKLFTHVKMLWDDKNLYIAAELTEPHVWGTITQRDAVIFHDNDFEIFLDVDCNGFNYYEIEINALNTVWDLLLTKAHKDMGKPVNSWNLDGMTTGIRINGSLNDPISADTSWIVEMSLPFSELMKGKNPEKKPGDGVLWRVNFSRVEWITDSITYRKQSDPATGRQLPEQNWVWSPMGLVSMHIPERWGRIEFSEKNVAPQSFNFLSKEQEKDFCIWLWMNGHPSWTTEKWDSLFSDLKSAMISGILTAADPATLKMIIPVAGKYGIKVQKWFVTMMNNDTSLINSHPDWFVISGEGKSSVTNPAYVGYYRFLCPSNPEVRHYLKKKLDEYLAIPGLDGIHLDYIRYPDVILPQGLWQTYGIIQDKEYPQYDYCYCDKCREKFRIQTGADPFLMNDPSASDAWREFRYDQITGVVTSLAEHCHKAGMKISAAVFPGPSIARQIVRQQWDKWPLDEVMPMFYQDFYLEGTNWIKIQTEEGVKDLKGKQPLYSGLYIPSLNSRDLRNAIQKSIDGGANGISLFNYEAMTASHWAVIKDIVKE